MDCLAWFWTNLVVRPRDLAINAPFNCQRILSRGLSVSDHIVLPVVHVPTTISTWIWAKSPDIISGAESILNKSPNSTFSVATVPVTHPHCPRIVLRNLTIVCLWRICLLNQLFRRPAAHPPYVHTLGKISMQFVKGQIIFSQKS